MIQSLLRAPFILSDFKNGDVSSTDTVTPDFKMVSFPQDVVYVMLLKIFIVSAQRALTFD